jgi:hypothetical protein
MCKRRPRVRTLVQPEWIPLDSHRWSWQSIYWIILQAKDKPVTWPVLIEHIYIHDWVRLLPIHLCNKWKQTRAKQWKSTQLHRCRAYHFLLCHCSIQFELEQCNNCLCRRLFNMISVHVCNVVRHTSRKPIKIRTHCQVWSINTANSIDDICKWETFILVALRCPTIRWMFDMTLKHGVTNRWTSVSFFR